MNCYRTASTVFVVLCVGWMYSTGAAQDAVDPPIRVASPNIVFFFVDDMGWQDTSVPFHTETTKLNRTYHTPHMERLAREGVKFTQAYAYAVCSPSRVSVMTGMNAARHRVTNWTLRRDRSPDRPHPAIELPRWNLNGLSPDPSVPRTVTAPTLPGLLQDAGYRTIHVGKAHFGAKMTPGEDPRNLGFDVNIAGHAAGGPGSYHGEKNFSAAWRNADRIWDVPGLEAYHGKPIDLTEALTREAIVAVEQAVADQRPFYLYLSHYTVHAPWETDFRFAEKYKQAGLKGIQHTLATMLEGMDRSLGDVLDAIERLGVADNTIVVFMSDNGAPSQVPRNLPLRGHKITPYEGGFRVPLIVRWPGQSPQAATCSAPVHIDDIFPTFLEVAGVALPAGPLDGQSFVRWVRKPETPPAERSLFWHFPHHYGEPPYSAIRRGDWKLIYFHVDQRLELYNLVADLSEKTSLVAKEPEKVRELAKRLGDHLRACQADMPTIKATSQPVPWPDQVAAKVAEATP